MKKRIVERMLMAACVVCTLVVMTGCDDLMAALDNPVKSYLQVETSRVIRPWQPSMLPVR